MAFTVIPAARHCLIPYRRGRLRFMLQTAQLLPPPWLSTLGFDPARFQTQPPACYRASWQLPGPDSHWQATTILRYDRSAITLTGAPSRGHGWSVCVRAPVGGWTLVDMSIGCMTLERLVGLLAARLTEPVMPNACVADVVSDHVISTSVVDGCISTCGSAADYAAGCGVLRRSSRHPTRRACGVRRSSPASTVSSPPAGWSWCRSARNARTMSPSSSWPGSPAARDRCSSAERRRRRWCGARSDATTRTAGNPTRGWFARPRSSTTSTSIAWTTISARSSSS